MPWLSASGSVWNAWPDVMIWLAAQRSKGAVSRTGTRAPAGPRGGAVLAFRADPFASHELSSGAIR